jgi:hypothetical protein
MIKYFPESEFWKSVYPDGMTSENITNELKDLEFLAGELPKVYMHLTGSMASNPMIYADVINSLHDDYITDIVNEHLEEQKEIFEADIKFLESEIERLKNDY